MPADLLKPWPALGIAHVRFHELVHALLGLLDETRDFVVQVGDPSGPSERGYRVDSQLPNPQATDAENCAVGFAGLGSTDFTR